MRVKTGALLSMVLTALAGRAFAAETGSPRVALETSKGRIVVELAPDKAPQTVANFLAYVRAGHYDGTIFHRVIDGFMIQGGGFTSELKQKATRPPVPNEAATGLSNRRGTIAMARTSDPHSATSQFFINTADNSPLDFRSRDEAGYGYTAFGHIVEGLDVVDAIAKVATGRQGGMADVPREPVVIQKAAVIE